VRHFELELQTLRETIIRMSSLVDEQIDYAISALLTSNEELKKLVIERDQKVNEFDIQIDQQCERILARTQPVAIDLRLLLTALNVNRELERIGDIAVNIAERTDAVQSHKDILYGVHFSEMADKAREMVKHSIDAFIHEDAALAREVCCQDEIVDEYNHEIFDALVSQMKSQPDTIESGAHLMILTRHLERLADHATNIAENVVFLVDAKIIKHGAGE